MKGWAYNFLNDLFKSLSEKNEKVVLMRSYDWLADKPIGDIDLLVSPKDVTRVKTSIDSFTHAKGWTKIFEDKDANHTHLVYVNTTGEELQSAHIDLQTSLGRKGFTYATTESVMQNPDKVDDILQQNEPASTLSLALHVLLDKDEVKDSYREIILSADQDTLRAALERALNTDSAKLIIKWVEEDFPQKDAPQLKRIVRSALSRKHPANTVYPWIHKLLRVARYFYKNNGVMIAALGPDGAGKSSVVESVENQLKFGAFPVASVYMGKRETYLPTSKLIRYYYNLKNKKSHDGNEDPVPHELKPNKDQNKKKRLASRIKEILGLTNWFIEQWARYLIEIRPTLQQGGVVLCDRYIYDLADRSKNSVVYSKSFASFLTHFYPTPDITYFYWEEPEVLFERKRENTIERSAFLINNYRAILSNIPNTEEIRTNIDVETISHGVIKSIVTKMEV